MDDLGRQLERIGRDLKRLSDEFDTLLRINRERMTSGIPEVIHKDAPVAPNHTGATMERSPGAGDRFQ